MYLNNGQKATAWILLLAVCCLVGLLILPGLAYAQDEEVLEVGDAPTSWNSSGVLMTAYPAGGPLGVQANFPVVVFPSAPAPDGYGMCHYWGQSYLGPPLMPSKTPEWDADSGFDADPVNNIDPLTDTPDQDGHDDGVTFPGVLPHCSPVNILVQGQIWPPAEYYVDAWFDWNRDGDWNDKSVCGCGDDEWAVKDWPVTGDAITGLLSVSIPIVPCHPVSDTDPLWVRVTLSERELLVLWDDGANPEYAAGGIPFPGWEACMLDGETEDYYLMPEAPPEEFVPEWGSIVLLGSGLAGLAGYATLRLRSGQALRWRTRE